MSKLLSLPQHPIGPIPSDQVGLHDPQPSHTIIDGELDEDVDMGDEVADVAGEAGEADGIEPEEAAPPKHQEEQDPTMPTNDTITEFDESDEASFVHVSSTAYMLNI